MDNFQHAVSKQTSFQLFLILYVTFHTVNCNYENILEAKFNQVEEIKSSKLLQGEIPNSSLLEIRPAMTRMAVLLVKLEQYAEAAEELRKFPNIDDLMGKVVRDVYGGHQSNIKHCLRFLSEQNCDAIASGISVLYDEMREHNHLSQPEVLLFVEYIRMYECTRKPEVIEIKTKLQPHVTSILSKLGSDIRQETYQMVTTTFDWQNDNTYILSFEYQMPKLVQLTFNGNDTNFLATLKFIQYLPSFGGSTGSGPGIYALIQELVKLGKTFSSEMIQVAKYLHLTEFQWITHTNSKPTHESFSNALELVPWQIQGLFWKNYCGLKNKKFSEYLSVDQNSTRFFKSWNAIVEGWKLKSYTTNKWEVFFTLTYLYRTRNYLCAEKSNHSRFVCSLESLDEADWVIKPAPSENNRVDVKFFLLLNKSTNEYLSATLNERNLNELKLQGSKTIDAGSYWELFCKK